MYPQFEYGRNHLARGNNCDDLSVHNISNVMVLTDIRYNISALEFCIVYIVQSANGLQ